MSPVCQSVIYRARARQAAGEPRAALADLTAALSLKPNSVELQRAAAAVRAELQPAAAENTELLGVQCHGEHDSSSGVSSTADTESAHQAV